MTNIGALCFILLVIQCNGQQQMPSNTIQISSKQTYTGLIQSEVYYIKYQKPMTFIVSGESDTFSKVTGLTVPFYHKQPLLYEIKFVGTCHVPHSSGVLLFVRLMIDDYLLYGDKLLPNNVERYQLLQGVDDLISVDAIGGGRFDLYLVTMIQCEMSSFVYLNPGLHVIDVGVRGKMNMPFQVMGGVLSIKLIQYDRNANIGVQPVTWPNVTFRSFSSQ
ncbi:unnamed protein product [Didymodactylos carnosus]|uniref:Uncharacterized protein n=1 Tax=Didymodactylos carnosus TaxID=1234261 RepID=A0A815ENB2_9BILA|nr:unnamed protein product [Didymodactylos carnosus]CAF1312672.1 unnamed protein product [Didymodactylos carnosus]CAF3729528.1 unnamed protein product [Didymodactylos carnosus]CAF4151680.1 unnamed protein product [Didymodactylos carnosus]